MEKAEKKLGLSKNAYGGCAGVDYVPYVPTTEAMPEITGYSIIMGILFALLFGAANTYLGLKVGLTIASAVPGAILAIGLLKKVFKRNNILEANVVSSLAAMGEALAGGIIFVLPALILLGLHVSVTTIIIVTVIGGLMGIAFITPVRRYLIVEEHGTLIYPEGMAAAEILVTGTEGAGGFKTIITGISIGAAFKMLSGGFSFWGEEAAYTIKSYQGTIVSIDTMASLLGVGFIVGTKTTAMMFAGSLIAWLALIPLLKLFGTGLTQPVFPSTVLISHMDANAIWSHYIRYIGAGAVAAGGFISLAKSLPAIYRSFKLAAGGMGKGEAGPVTRVNRETPLSWVIAAAVLGFLLVWFVPAVGGGPVGGIMAVVFSFFFAVVSGRMVGLIGESNNPVSGMTIAALLVVATVLKLMGQTGTQGMTTALMIGSVICIAIAVAGGSSQSLKTTFIIGGDPRANQVGMFVAVSVASVACAGTLMMLHKAYGVGSMAIPAPQATLMKLIVQGIMTGQLPWTLVAIGVALAVFCYLVDLPILAVAIGIYLPLGLTSAIFAGGIIRSLVERKAKKQGDEDAIAIDKGVLLASGLVAGDALMGIVVGMFAALGVNIGLGLKLFPAVSKSNLVALVMFLLLGAWMYWYSLRKARPE
jgi:putative OPT family oligopeptide transporter